MYRMWFCKDHTQRVELLPTRDWTWGRKPTHLWPVLSKHCFIICLTQHVPTTTLLGGIGVHPRCCRLHLRENGIMRLNGQEGYFMLYLFWSKLGFLQVLPGRSGWSRSCQWIRILIGRSRREEGHLPWLWAVPIPFTSRSSCGIMYNFWKPQEQRSVRVRTTY